MSKIRLSTNEPPGFSLRSNGERILAALMINRGLLNVFTCSSFEFAQRDALCSSTTLNSLFCWKDKQRSLFYWHHVVRHALSEDNEVSGVTFLNATLLCIADLISNTDCQLHQKTWIYIECVTVRPNERKTVSAITGWDQNTFGENIICFYILLF